MNFDAENKATRFAFVLPVYNHEESVARVIEKAKEVGFPIFVVNDGSTDRTLENIKDIPGIHIISHRVNAGKGAALKTGFAAAARQADWAITVDADGQHYPEDAQKLIAAIPAGTRPIVVGAREGMDAQHVPWTSRFGRKFSNFWVWAAGGPYLTDSQSGLRIYPLPEINALPTRAQRFQFEVEVLVKAKRNGWNIIEAPIRVAYANDGSRISHFRPFMDFIRNSLTFTRLIITRIFSLR